MKKILAFAFIFIALTDCGFSYGQYTDGSRVEDLEKKVDEFEDIIRNMLGTFTSSIKKLKNQVADLTERVNFLEENTCSFSSCQSLEKSVSSLSESLKEVETTSPSDCSGFETNDGGDGVYTLLLSNSESIDVYCDMKGGGWTVFQKRYDGSENFNRTFEEYSNGFGSPDGEYWLGLNNIHKLTQNGKFDLRVDLETFDGEKAFAEYKNFKVGPSPGFVLSIGEYNGNAGDSLRFHDLARFSTADKDQDNWAQGNCAENNRGAFWFSDCHHVNLNTYQYNDHFNYNWGSMMWFHWKRLTSLKASTMKLRIAN